MKISIGAIVLAASLLAGSAMAANILPGSGATVTGSDPYTGLGGLNLANATSNLINGTSLQTLNNGETRWIFNDGGSPSTPDQTLIVNLGSAKTIDDVGFVYGGQDRVPTSFSVLISSDGVNFTLLAGPSATTPGEYGDPGTYAKAFGLGSVTTQYVEYDFGVDSFKYSGCSDCGGGVGEGAGIVSLFIDSPAPEPAAWALMLVGFGGLGLALRSRGRTANA